MPRNLGAVSSGFRPGPSHSGAGPLGSLPTSLPRPFPGKDGCSEGEGSWGQLAGGHTAAGPEGDPGMCSGFLCDLEQVTSFLATTFCCVQVSCTRRQVSRPDRAGLELDIGKMLGSGYRSQKLQWGGRGGGQGWTTGLSAWVESSCDTCSRGTLGWSRTSELPFLPLV